MPAARFFTVVFEADALMILDDAGPEIFVHWYVVIFPSGSEEPLPSRVALSPGKLMA